jgi:hypothetical protein
LTSEINKTAYKQNSLAQLPVAAEVHEKILHTLLFFITTRCPLNCTHCAIKDVNRREEAPYNPEALESWFDDIASADFIREVNITGGEPFFVFERLINAVEIITRKGIPTSVVSSGYWASDNNGARDRLSLLAEKGLKTLYLSISAYHQQQVPLANVKTAITEAARQNLSIGILFYDHGRMNIGQVIKQLQEAIGENLFAKVHYLNFGPILAIGGARKNLKPEVFLKGTVKDFCTSIGPVIFANGEVIACCGEKLPSGSALKLGNLSRDKFADLLQRMRRSHVIPYLTFIGFNETVRFLKERGMFLEWDLTIPQHEICRRCAVISTNPEVIRILEEEMPDHHRMEIQLKQLLIYGYNFFIV